MSRKSTASRKKSAVKSLKGELPTADDIERFNMTEREVELIRFLAGGTTCRFLESVDNERQFEDYFQPEMDESGKKTRELGSGVYGSVFLCRAKATMISESSISSSSTTIISTKKVRRKSDGVSTASLATSSSHPSSTTSSTATSSTVSSKASGVSKKRSSGKRASLFFSKLFSSFSSSSTTATTTTSSLSKSAGSLTTSALDSESPKLFAAKRVLKATMLRSSPSVKVRLRYLRSMRSEVAMLRKFNETEGHGRELVGRMVDVFENDEYITIVSEYYSGGELYGYMKKHELSEEKVAQLAYQLTQAIRYIHEDCSAVHCDLKPENVMFEDDSFEKIRVIDFGMTRVVKPGDLLSDPCGSPYYTAPEIINTRSRKAAYSQPCDIWALGCLVFVLLYGYPAFAIDTSKYADSSAMKKAIYRNILDGFYPRVYPASSVGYGPWFPDTLPKSAFARDFIAKCLIQDPLKRTQIGDLVNHPWFHSFTASAAEKRAPLLRVSVDPAIKKSVTSKVSKMKKDAGHVIEYDYSFPSSSFVTSVILNSVRSLSSQSSYRGGLTPTLDSPVGSDESSIASRRKSIFPSPPSSSLSTEDEMLRYLQSALLRFDRRAWDLREIVVYIARVEVIEAWPQLFDCLLRMFKNMVLYQKQHPVSSSPASPDSVIAAAVTEEEKEEEEEGAVAKVSLRVCIDSSRRSTTEVGSVTDMIDFRSFMKVFRGEDRVISKDACRLVWSKLTQPSIFRLAMAFDGTEEGGRMVVTPKSLDYICFDDLVTAVVMDYLTHIPGCVEIAFEHLCQLCTQRTCGFPGMFGNSSLLTLSMSAMSPGLTSSSGSSGGSSARKGSGYGSAMGTSLSEFPFPEEYKCEAVDLPLVLDYLKQDQTTHSGIIHQLKHEQWDHMLHELSIRVDKDSVEVGPDEFKGIFQSAFV